MVEFLQHFGRWIRGDPVRKHVPEFPSYDTPVTIRHLLSHTSGRRGEPPGRRP